MIPAVLSPDLCEQSSQDPLELTAQATPSVCWPRRESGMSPSLWGRVPFVSSDLLGLADALREQMLLPSFIYPGKGPGHVTGGEDTAGG